MAREEPARDGMVPARFTLALIVDVIEVLDRHGYGAPTGLALADLICCLHRSLHPEDFLPPPAGFLP